MSHAITLRDLLLFLGAAAGLLTAGVGVLMFFAGMMSDAASYNGSTGRGCLAFFVGVLVLVGCIVALFR
jgi:hypothetical protein